ncbi:MAG: BCCT family transporter [Firmicutes bacterium]|nr:BCCT family transporter [Bacillota bacterium]
MNISMKEARKRGLRPAVILFPVLIFATLIIIGLVDGKAFIGMLNTVFQSLMVNGSWFISLGTLISVIFMIFVFFHPIGKVKLGGKDAKPEFSMWNWFAISLCSGIGTGIVFWGAVEPLKFAMEPQASLGITPGSSTAVIWALSKSYMQWSFAPYATYAIFGVVIAFAYFNLRKPYCVSSAFSPLLGQRAEKKWVRGVVDTLTVFAITGGVAGSLGYGLLQIGSGLSTLFGMPLNNLTYSLICLFIVVVYNISSISGMKKGIKWLSDKNAWMFIILMVLAFVCGPAQWICNLFTESFGSFVSTFVESITAVSPFTDAGTAAGSVWYESSGLWPQWWDQFAFVDYFAFAPIVGLFCIKLAKGRTIREFVLMNWFVPAMFGVLWFAVFGGLTLDIQFNFAAYAGRVDLQGCATLYDYMLKFGNEAMMLKVIEVIPLASILKPIVLALIVLSFVTMADSMTSTVSLMTINRNEDVEEAPAALKLMWGILMGVAALVLTLTGNIEGIKMIKTIAGFPILLLGLIMIGMFVVYVLKKENKKTLQEMMDD